MIKNLTSCVTVTADNLFFYFAVQVHFMDDDLIIDPSDLWSFAVSKNTSMWGLPTNHFVTYS